MSAWCNCARVVGAQADPPLTVGRSMREFRAVPLAKTDRSVYTYQQQTSLISTAKRRTDKPMIDVTVAARTVLETTNRVTQPPYKEQQCQP